MGVTAFQAYLGDILHVVSQALLIPTIILLLLLMLYALFCIGSVLMEYFTERRNFKVFMPKFLSALMSAKQDDIPSVIKSSGLLNRQKIALLTVFDYRTLPGDALVAAIRRIVGEEEEHYERITARNNMAARVSPMIGLMGTLIPLGPGIQALGNADTAALSSSLLIAFDTTVAGLIVAAICLIIGKIRGIWYNGYMGALDAAMATMLEKIEQMRTAGELAVSEPTDYAFLFEKSIGKGNADPAVSKAHASIVEEAVQQHERDTFAADSVQRNRGYYDDRSAQSSRAAREYRDPSADARSREYAAASRHAAESRGAAEGRSAARSRHAAGYGSHSAGSAGRNVSLPSIETGGRDVQRSDDRAAQRGRHVGAGYDASPYRRSNY